MSVGSAYGSSVGAPSTGKPVPLSTPGVTLVAFGTQRTTGQNERLGPPFLIDLCGFAEFAIVLPKVGPTEDTLCKRLKTLLAPIPNPFVLFTNFQLPLLHFTQPDMSRRFLVLRIFLARLFVFVGQVVFLVPLPGCRLTLLVKLIAFGQRILV